jgi:hypothetical protein
MSKASTQSGSEDLGGSDRLLLKPLAKRPSWHCDIGAGIASVPLATSRHRIPHSQRPSRNAASHVLFYRMWKLSGVVSEGCCTPGFQR